MALPNHGSNWPKKNCCVPSRFLNPSAITVKLCTGQPHIGPHSLYFSAHENYSDFKMSPSMFPFMALGMIDPVQTPIGPPLLCCYRDSLM